MRTRKAGIGAKPRERLIDAASVKKLPDGVRELTWGTGGQTITVKYRAVTSPGPTAARGGGARSASSSLRGLKLPELVAGADVPASAVDSVAHAAQGAAP